MVMMADCGYTAVAFVILAVNFVNAGQGGIRCYTCSGALSNSGCKQVLTECPSIYQACQTVVHRGTIDKRCRSVVDCWREASLGCTNGKCSYCCDADKCNLHVPLTHTSPAVQDSSSSSGSRDDPCDPNPCHNGGTCEPREIGCQSGSCGSSKSSKSSKSKRAVSQVHGRRSGRAVHAPEKVPAAAQSKSGSGSGGTGFECHCPDGYEGEYCEISVSPAPCLSNPCQHGGTCHDNEKGGYWCECPSGFDGHHCEIESPSPCDSHPCQNGGTCHNDDGGYWCECSEGYAGQHCETAPPDPCSSLPCQNGGTCHIDGRGYWCECREGYEGRHCERETGRGHPCDSQPCHNGGTCHRDGDGYWCECPSEFKGHHCETPPSDPCSSLPCQNGGTCHKDGGGYWCECGEGYEGHRCETEVGGGHPCDTHPCHNGGTCHREGDGFWCECPTEFIGHDCDNPYSPPGGGYNCQENNPCTEENLANEDFYWPHDDPAKFVQCDEFGGCYVMDCPPGTIWNQESLDCVHP